MSARLDFEEYGDAIGDAWAVLRDHANRAGPGARVPTCPDWDVRALVAHQGTVHRWATGVLLGEDRDSAALEAEGLAAVDQLDWLDTGARSLLQALVDAPDDLDVFFFLKDAAPPKFAWARRQCHETSIHAVDAMSASLGAPPSAAQTWLSPMVAADGVDELLTGFLPRRHQVVRSREPLTVVVRASDVDAAWTLRISSDPVITTPGAAATPDTTWTGTAAQLYLGLWNRGDEIEETQAPFLERWRQLMTVRFG